MEIGSDLNTLIIDQVDSFAADNSIFMMYLCFVIGVVHLSVAHALKGFKMIKSGAPHLICFGSLMIFTFSTDVISFCKSVR